jgi:molybdopterin biosynthesis enzyme MoaB
LYMEYFQFSLSFLEFIGRSTMVSCATALVIVMSIITVKSISQAVRLTILKVSQVLNEVLPSFHPLCNLFYRDNHSNAL